MAMSKFDWEGNFYLEFSDFTKRAYDILDKNPKSPNYVGTFKQAERKYFDYLQAKGRGEDVKSPFTISNIGDPDFIHNYSYSSLLFSLALIYLENN